MKKISLFLIFALVLNCLTPFAFAESLETTVEYSKDFGSSPDVNTVSVDSGFAAQLDGAKFVIFPIELTQSGVYDIYITAASEEGGNVKVQLSPEPKEDTSIPVLLGNVNTSASFTKILADSLTLSSGEHKIRVTGAGGINYIKSVSLIKREDAESYRLYAPSVLEGGVVPSGGNATVSGTYAYCWEHGTDFVGGTTITFNMNVEMSGKYNLYMCAGSDSADFNIKINGTDIYEGNWTTENHSVFKKELIKNVVLKEGNTTVSITCLGSDSVVLYLNHLDFVLTNSKLEISEIKAETSDLTKSDSVPVNTDVFKIKFMENIRTSDATDKNIKLMCGAEEIPALITASDDVITIALKKTLIKGKIYTLTVNDIYNKDEVLSCGENTFVFETGDASADNASLELSEYSIVDGVVTVKGYVKSSCGELLAGRKVSLYKKNSTEELSYKLTDEAGGFILTYNIYSETEAGMIDFVIKTEYCSTEKLFSVLYVTKEAEEDFVDVLKSMSDADDAKTLFETNEEILSIDVSEDISGLSEEGIEKVFGGLCGLTVNSISEVRTVYYTRIAMMQVAEAKTTSEIELLLGDEEVCQSLRINMNMLSDISSYMEDISEEMLSLDAQDDEEVFVNNVFNLLNGFALSKYSKADTDIEAENVSAYLTQECEIPLSLKDNLTDVKKVILYVSSENEGILSTVSLKLSDGTREIIEEDGKIKIEIIPFTDSVLALGSLKLSSDVSGEYEIKIRGEVIYDKDLTYVLSSKLNEKTIVLNVLDEMPPEKTTYFSDSLLAAEGVDVIDTDDGKAGFIEGAEYIIFPVTVDKSGKYEIYATVFTGEVNTSLKAQTSMEVTDKVSIPSKSGENTDSDLYEKYLLRTEYLGAGTHRVRVSTVSGNAAVMAVTALRTEEKEAYRKYAKSTYDMNVSGVTVSGTYAAYYDDGTDMVGGTTTTFDIDVENSGFYDLYLTTASANGANVTATINDKKNINTYIKTNQHIELEKRYLGTVCLADGKQTVSVTCVGSDSDVVIINSIDLILKSRTLNVESLFADTKNLMSEDADASTDVITISFNADIKTDDLTEDNVKLYTDNKEIPFEMTAKGKEIVISLKKSLKTSMNVKLSVSGIKDESGNITVDAFEKIFSVGSTFTNNASVIVTESQMQNEKLTVKGIVKSKAGVGISDRKVFLYKDSLSGELLKEGTSGENGMFTFDYTMPENSISGMHKFVIKTEYAENTADFSEIYVTKEEENTFLNNLSQTLDAEDVKTLFEENEDKLSVDVSSDTENISTDGMKIIFSGLASKELVSITEARNKYYSRIAMVKMSESKNVEDALVLLDDSDILKSLRLDASQLSDIGENINEFASDLMSIIPKADENDYISAAGELLSGYVLEKYSKSDSDILIDDENIYTGQIAVMEISSEKELTEVKEIVLVFKNTNSDVISRAEFIQAEGITSETVKTENEMKVVLKTSNASVKLLGTIEISGDTEGMYSFSVSGKVIYDKNLDYELSSKLNEKEVNLSVTKNSNKGSSGSSGGGGNLSGNLGSVKEPEVSTRFEFADIDSCLWAKEAIEYLLAGGIISESEDKKFRPDASITREEFVKMIVVALGVYDSGAESMLKDVNINSWYYRYVASAEKIGLVFGDDRGNFGSGNNITREDISVIINRALKLIGFNSDKVSGEIFADDSSISDYAKEAVYNMKKLGIVNGVGDNMFAPKMHATRAQTAKMMFEMLKAVGK